MPNDLAAATELALAWIRETFGRGFPLPESVAAGEPTLLNDGEYTLAFATAPLLASDDARWQARRQLVEELIADGLPARVALWAPAGADLPSEEPALSEFVALVRQAAVKLGPRERSHVALPATLYLRKNADTGGVVSVTGGLNPHWARFTERVRGQYDLDSTQVHRLPESGEHLERLLDTIVERTESLEVRQVATIETIDAWTIVRLSGDTGVYIVGVPPAAAADVGLAVRRNLRRTLVDVVPRLRAGTADARAMFLLGPYARIEQEGATTAMRGYDASLYSGVDFVCLVADGVVKPLIQPASGVLSAAGG